MSTQRQRIEKVAKYAYRELRKMIPDSLDKDLIGKGDYFGNFHAMGLLSLCYDYGNEWEIKYCTDYLFKALKKEKIGIEFSGGYAYRLLRNYGERCDKKLKQEIIKQLDEALPKFYQYEQGFMGVNDNFPAWAILFGYCTYLRTGDKNIYEITKNRIADFRRRLERTTDSSEFNSPTYLQITLTNFAEVMAITPKTDSIYKDCKYCLNKLILSSLKRYHKGLKKVGAPYGRAYTVDSVGHYHHTSFVMYQVLGEEEFIDLPEIIYGEEYYRDGHIIHGDRVYYMCNFYNATRYYYDLTEEVIEEYKNLPKYPYVVKGSAEVSASADKDIAPSDMLKDCPREIFLTDELFEYSAGLSNLYTYMSKNYMLGSADKEFHNGVQSEGLFFNGRGDNGAPATVFFRMVTNGKKPDNYRYPLLIDEGRKFALQTLSSAIVAYHLKDLKEEIKDISVYAVIYNKLKCVDEIKKQDNKVFLRIGKAYIMLAPLNEDKLKKVDIEEINGYILVKSHLKLDKKANAYRRGKMLNTGGYIVETAESKDYKSMEDFINKVGRYAVKDELFANRNNRMAVTRRIKYDSKTVHIESEQSVISEGFVYKDVYRKDGKKVKEI